MMILLSLLTLYHSLQSKMYIAIAYLSLLLSNGLFNPTRVKVVLEGQTKPLLTTCGTFDLAMHQFPHA